MECDCEICQNEDFCPDCGEYKYECCCEEENEGHGTSDIAPWEKRGISIQALTNNCNWEVAWPVLGKGHTSFDPCQRAADFYLLEALSNNIPAMEGTSHIKRIELIEIDDYDMLFDGLDVDTTLIEKAYELGKKNVSKSPESYIGALMGEAELLLRELVDETDEVLVEYFHMAVAGEARHHRAVGGRILSGSRARSAAWVGWKTLYQTLGEQGLLDLAELFYEFDDGSFGGPPWAQACEVLYERLTGQLGPDEFTNKKMFVDRAWTLEHNGGCFLNKIDWAVKNPKGWGLGYLKDRVLEAHAQNPTNFKLLLRVASKKVVKLYEKYYNAQNEYRAINGLELVTNWVTESNNPKEFCHYCGSDPTKGLGLSCLNRPLETIKIEDEDEYAYKWDFWSADQKFYALDKNKHIVPGKYSVGIYFTVSDDKKVESHQFNKTHFTIKDDSSSLLDVVENKIFNYIQKNWPEMKHKGALVGVNITISKTFEEGLPYEINNNKVKSLGINYIGYSFDGKDWKPEISAYSSKSYNKIKKLLTVAKPEKVLQPMWTYDLQRKLLPESKAKVITVESMVM